MSAGSAPSTAELARQALAHPDSVWVGWGAGDFLRALWPLDPLPLAWVADGDPDLHGARAAGVPVRPPEALRGEDPGCTWVVVYSGAHDPIRLQVARLGPYRVVPAEALLDGPPVGPPAAPELAADPLAVSVRRRHAPEVLRLRPGDRFAIAGAGPRARALAAWCAERERTPVAFLDDGAGAGECDGIAVWPLAEGVARLDPEKVLVADEGDDPALRERVRALLQQARERRKQSALDAWRRHCRALEAERLPRRAWAVRWAEGRHRLYETTGPFPCPTEDEERLRALRDRHRGERLFVIGNGPSLNRLPLEKLEGEWSFGFNRIHLLYDRVSWRCDFYTANDWRVAPDIAEEIDALRDTTVFVPQRFRGMLREGPHVVPYWCRAGLPDGRLPVEERFAFDPTRGVCMGATVAVIGIQLAFWMGFDPIVLIGFDLDYRIPKSVRREGLGRYGRTEARNLESTEDDDSAHFDPRYFGRGARWHEPSIRGMHSGFRNCLDAAESRGRRIWNATAGGRLEVFPRVAFADLFPRPGRSPRAATAAAPPR